MREENMKRRSQSKKEESQRRDQERMTLGRSGSFWKTRHLGTNERVSCVTFALSKTTSGFAVDP
jgi:hypothetical protein